MCLAVGVLEEVAQAQLLVVLGFAVVVPVWFVLCYCFCWLSIFLSAAYCIVFPAVGVLDIVAHVQLFAVVDFAMVVPAWCVLCCCSRWLSLFLSATHCVVCPAVGVLGRVV